MGKALAVIATIVLPVFLSGCLASKDQFITVGNAFYPFNELVYKDSDGKNITLKRQGDVYSTSDSRNTTILFHKINGDQYIVQSTTNNSGKLSYEYYVIKDQDGSFSAFGDCEDLNDNILKKLDVDISEDEIGTTCTFKSFDDLLQVARSEGIWNNAATYKIVTRN